jgi:hypothetical protein
MSIRWTLISILRGNGLPSVVHGSCNRFASVLPSLYFHIIAQDFGSLRGVHVGVNIAVNEQCRWTLVVYTLESRSRRHLAIHHFYCRRLVKKVTSWARLLRNFFTMSTEMRIQRDGTQSLIAYILNNPEGIHRDRPFLATDSEPRPLFFKCPFYSAKKVSNSGFLSKINGSSGC